MAKENERKYWFVFCTPGGYSVTPKKLTLEEFESAYFSTKTKYDFLDKLGFCYHENFISEYYYSLHFTQKKAWEFADRKNLIRFENFKSELKGLFKEYGEEM